MVFIMPYFISYNGMNWLVRFAGLLILGLMLIAATIQSAYSEGNIKIKSFALEATGVGYQINVDAAIELNNTLEQALEKGIVLYFVIRFALIDTKWYWVDDEVARSKLRIGLSYNALTRQYRLSHRSKSQGFDTLSEALQELGTQHHIPVEEKLKLKPNMEYLASLQVWLDASRLSKPFQLESLSSKEWNLSSEKKEWRTKLPVAHSFSIQ